MVSITIHSKSNKEIQNLNVCENKLVIDCSKVIETTNSFTIEIEFEIKISSFRNHDYTWQDVNSDRIANEYTPKIIKLADGNYVQANINQGIWEVHKKNPYKLIWKFNPQFSKPITQYVGSNVQKRIYQANSKVAFVATPTLLFSKIGAVEISRSKIPFSAIACFTDHCDFDTLDNLKVQRQLFSETNIKVTKGFFINHFSKRNDNASYENDKQELDLWQSNGHEMCYHSLSQSIKSDDESFSDFEKFKNPYSSEVWIDHGYQPYNFSLFKNHPKLEASFESILKQKDIKILWNYIDSGTATTGVINQLNGNHFTLNSFLQGNKNLSTMKMMQAMIKNIVFHYLNEEKIITNYKTTAQNFKKIVFQRKLKLIPKFIKDFAILFSSIASVLLFWNSKKNNTFKLSKYTPLFFKHTILNEEFVVFQTLEMIDFSKSLQENNINLLIKEAGIFIAHTYFSDSVAYHEGKMVTKENAIEKQVAVNFKYLGLKIAENKIWNPTLSELVSYFDVIDQKVISFDENGKLVLNNNQLVPVRMIK